MLSTILSQERANRKIVPEPLRLTDSLDLYAKGDIEFLPRSLGKYVSSGEVVEHIGRYCRLANALRGPAHAATKGVLLQFLVEGLKPPSIETCYKQCSYRLLKCSANTEFWREMNEAIPHKEVRKPPHVVQRLELRASSLHPFFYCSYSRFTHVLSYDVFSSANHVLLCFTGEHDIADGEVQEMDGGK